VRITECEKSSSDGDVEMWIPGIPGCKEECNDGLRGQWSEFTGVVVGICTLAGATKRLSIL